MRLPQLLAVAAAILTLTGCHSAFVEATVSNHTPDPISEIEVDYPSASFGTQSLAPGTDFHYRFKILGSGPTTLTWTDAAHHDHKSPGPAFHENDEGRLTITFQLTGPVWNKQLISLAPR